MLALQALKVRGAGQGRQGMAWASVSMLWSMLTFDRKGMACAGGGGPLTFCLPPLLLCLLCPGELLLHCLPRLTACVCWPATPLATGLFYAALPLLQLPSMPFILPILTQGWWRPEATSLHGIASWA